MVINRSFMCASDTTNDRLATVKRTLQCIGVLTCLRKQWASCDSDEDEEQWRSSCNNDLPQQSLAHIHSRSRYRAIEDEIIS